MKNDREFYKKSVLEHYNNSKKDLNLEHVTPAILKRKLINIVLNNTLTKLQKNSIKNYFDASENETDLLKIVKKNTQDYKSIQYFLNGTTNTITKHGLLEVTALILNYTNTKENTDNSEKTNENSDSINHTIEVNIDNTNNFKNWTYIIAILAIVSITSIFFYVKSNEKNDEVCGYWKLDRYITIPCNDANNSLPITIINTQEVHINTFRKLAPTKLNNYLDNDKASKVWYASYNNDLNFFNESGVHPISGEVLKPANQKIIKTYYLDLQHKGLDIENNNNKENTKTTKIKTLKAKVIITNNDELDESVSFYFKNNYKNPIDNYTCKGTVKYMFTKSTLNNKLIVCNLSLIYQIISNKTQAEIESRTINTIGSGFTETESKQNAISKILF